MSDVGKERSHAQARLRPCLRDGCEPRAGPDRWITSGRAGALPGENSGRGLTAERTRVNGDQLSSSAKLSAKAGPIHRSDDNLQSRYFLYFPLTTQLVDESLLHEQKGQGR